MKRLLLIIPGLLLMACQGAGQKQKSLAVEAQAEAAQASAPAEEVVPSFLPEEAEENIYGYEGDEEEEIAYEAPVTDYWYEHDFSLVLVTHTYVGLSTAMPQTDETVLITRVGDKAYIQTRLQGAIRKCSVYEATPEGYRHTIYEKGKVSWTHDYDNDSLTGALAYQLRKKYPVIATIPEDYDMSQAQEGTRCGRPCWIITLEEDTDLGRGHLVSTLWLDKEYCFLYSVSIKGTNDLGNTVDMESFEVTYFTDAPTGKDIPDPAQTGGGVADDMKKQLQGQIDALTK